ncbi:MAG TPA: tRNA uridine-5-carboxymethylaminomethyl(34) synthesis GTPase MnmE [Candidatus Scatomonas pullistercoris]|uniref:tRNA modification GTPase MnmE n=1 Tax=Candidatus Scatomonas pullistercoris TaxID=2840920 RepID=A0A9D1P4T6_9FIRM|nr:tRNA uridine-5-carboxymethylaminomethyl(34) synthesis GTPase MnmE [Candidatus Scatomonas pullistercoris]
MADVYEDTIAAVSTAMAPGGIGIVRISGKEAFSIADKIFRGKRGKRLSEQEGNTIHYGWIEENGQAIDEVLAVVLRHPHSYTGEDTVEIDCHGGILAMNRILEAVLRAGARPADPGEFTKRAFLNGRMDLSQAEAVMDLIQAKNEYALKNSFRQLQGSVKKKIQDIREKLLYEIAFIESALDDPEHTDLTGYPEKLGKIVMEQKAGIEKLIAASGEGRLLQEGIKTVILGRPNAGKSSLLNLLAGEEKAIVTEIEGTTRDIVEEQINVRGITLRLLDTAGIRDSSSPVEQIGIERAKEQAMDADLILYVVDSSAPLNENDRKIMELIRNKKTIVLLNKNDLEAAVKEEELKEKLDAPVISISVKEKKGIHQLETVIQELFFHGGISFNDEIYITSARHRSALEAADKSLKLVENSIADGLPEDFYSIDLMDAYESLGKILGESVGEDLVNEIFSKFCTGK